MKSWATRSASSGMTPSKMATSLYETSKRLYNQMANCYTNGLYFYGLRHLLGFCPGHGQTGYSVCLLSEQGQVVWPNGSSRLRSPSNLALLTQASGIWLLP